GVALLPAGETDDLHAGRQFAVNREIVQGGHELAVRQVAGGAENHNRARLRARTGDEVFAKRVRHGQGAVWPKVGRWKREMGMNSRQQPDDRNRWWRMPGGKNAVPEKHFRMA